MTRTEADAKSMTIRPPRGRTPLRRLLALPVALALVAAFMTPAVAAASSGSGLSGYNHPSTGKQETLPSKSKTTPTPQSEAKPATTTPTTTVAPSSESSPAKASSLPFTGLDLRWVVGFGLLMMGAGASIVTVQRRQHRGGSGR